jgi:hypothetical protein
MRFGFPHSALILATLLTGSASAVEFTVFPAQVALDRNFAQCRLLVTEGTAEPNERSTDLTAKATLQSSDPNVVRVLPDQRVIAVANGSARVTVAVDGATREVPVTVTGIEAEPKINFVEQVLPVLSKAGCNAGACHASQHGKGGFTLSVMGYDPPADHKAIVRDRMQRRVNLLQPEESLLLRKPALSVPHGGGKRLDATSPDYQLFAAWVGAGCPEPKADAAKVTKLKVFPNRRVVAVGNSQQIRVEALWSDGRTTDVTHWAKFDSLDDGVVGVTPAGLSTTVGPGQGSVMVRFEGQADICLVTVPYAPTVDLAGWTNHNFVDELAAAKFTELGIPPSPVCDDATFLRRAFFDAVGTLPTPEESVAFLDSSDPDKRKKLVDRLLGFTGDPAQDIHNDKYAAFWTIKWSDLIRNNSRDLGEQGMWALHNWLRESFRTNKPFDKFATELVTAKGSIFSNGPANLFRVANNPADQGEMVSQLFLGTRLACAKCHHHPFEKYSQDDYYGFAAFFARVGNKTSQEFGLFGGETVVIVRSGGEVGHPKTGKIMKPTPLDAEPVDDPVDRRLALAKWMTSVDNEPFARNIVNRYVRYLLGRGLVEPVDDLRATNPASNPALMDALVRDLRSSGFNVKHLMRTIMHSRLYQLDSQPLPANASDNRFYSHFLVKRISAEPLLDAIDAACQSSTKFTNLPPGTRAIELPDAEYQNYFLQTFGKPKRVSVCECERIPDENLAQALHTLNGDILQGKIVDAKGRVARLVAEKKPHGEIVNELYLATLCRRPTPEEVKESERFLAESGSPAECYQDLLWALINSKQFLFVR